MAVGYSNDNLFQLLVLIAKAAEKLVMNEQYRNHCIDGRASIFHDIEA